jgi:hypothetical protein
MLTADHLIGHAAGATGGLQVGGRPQAWRTPSCRESMRVLSPSLTAAASRWLLLLLSRLLSAL